MKMITCRGTFIANVINELNSKSYLEIGLSNNPKAPYRMIDVEDKTAVDLNPLTNPDFCISSDDFFDKVRNGETKFDKEHKWDVVFIDGNHLAHQVYKDLCNAIEHLKDDGLIFLHDVLPWTYDMTIESQVGGKIATCQDAWKVIQYCLQERDDVDVCTVPENQGGLGIVKKRVTPRQDMLDKEHNRFYQFCLYAKDTISKMNCKSEEEVLEWIRDEDPTYNFSK